MSRTICARLLTAIRAAVDPLKLPYEVVITDDCSKDKSWEILKELARLTRASVRNVSLLIAANRPPVGRA